jgi:hypothetical protein
MNSRHYTLQQQPADGRSLSQMSRASNPPNTVVGVEDTGEMEPVRLHATLFKCPQCEYTARRPGRVREHMARVHKDNVELPAMKEVLTKSPLVSKAEPVTTSTRATAPDSAAAADQPQAPIASDLDAALAQIEQTEAGFACPLCVRSLATTRRNMVLHIQRVHFGIQPYNCKHDGCTYKTSRRVNFDVHCRTEHAQTNDDDEDDVDDDGDENEAREDEHVRNFPI